MAMGVPLGEEQQNGEEDIKAFVPSMAQLLNERWIIFFGEDTPFL